MKKILVSICIALSATQFITGQVAINTDGSLPNSSAMLDIKSIDKGLLTPRLTTAQRTAIASPATGLVVYDTDVNKFFYYAIGSWIEMGTGSATNYWTLNGTNINNNNTGNVGIGISNPLVALHVSKSTDELVRLQGVNPYLSFYNNGAVKAYVQSYNDDLLLGTILGNTNGAIRFYNNNVNNMSILPNGNVGIGIATPGSPLSFPNTLGNKISFWNNDATHDFGIGIASGAMRLYTAGQDKISFGWGDAGSFAEAVSIHTGTGLLAYPNVLGDKISFWKNDATHDFGIGIASGAMRLYTAGQDRISFGWGNTNSFSESATLFTGNGFLGLNTTNPLAQLHINRDAEALRISGSGSYLSFYNGATYKGYLWSKGANDIELATAVGNTTGNLSLGVQGSPYLTVQSDGRVRVGNSSANLAVGSVSLHYPKFSVNGPIGIKDPNGSSEWALHIDYTSAGGNNDIDNLAFFFNGGKKAWIEDTDGSYNDISDARLKENFIHYKPVLNEVKKLEVFTYHYKADKTGRRSFGLVAQNLKQYFPELVSGSEEGGNYLGIAYAKTGVLAIKAIQEQQVIIEEQQKRIEALEKRLAALESKLK